MVEYALVVVLVAVVAIGALGLIGLAVSRIYGLIDATVGARKNGNTDTSHADYLYFDPNQLPRCGFYMDEGGGHTILYGQLWVGPGIPISEVTASTDTSMDVSLNPNGTANLYNIQQILTAGRDDGACPHAIVVQSSKAYGGQTLFYPVEIRDWS